MSSPDITDVIGKIPYRMAFAGGWIDQPFISKLNPSPPGSMVVVGLHPTFRFMERAGMATGTRRAAAQLWPDGIPAGEPMRLVKELYAFENKNQADPSGSQDMIGLIYNGVCRLDFDYSHEGGYFPRHIETNDDPDIARWLERVVHMLPIEPRPADYSPLGVKNLDPELIRQLGQSGKDCYDAILRKDIHALGGSFNACMALWEALMPGIVRHPTIKCDLVGIMKHYQRKYPGAMYSGCGGGYLYVLSEEAVPGAIRISVR